MAHEHETAGPCDFPLYGWSDYQRARERFLRERAAEARAASSDRAVAAVADGATATADPPPARAVVE